MFISLERDVPMEGYMVTRPFGKPDFSNMRLRGFEVYFEIRARRGPDAWRSSYDSVQNLLDHLSRYTKSESSRVRYLNHLRQFCRWCALNPDQLVSLPKDRVEALVQRFVDELAGLDRSRACVNSVIKRLRTFFRANDIKDLDLKTYFVPTRYRKKPEYIPTKDEVHAIASAAGNPRNRALILCLWSSGLRVSTLTALNYGDVAGELEEGKPCILIRVYPEMKSRVADACKGSIPYHTFICAEAVEALRAHLRDREERHGPISDNDPLFHSEWSLWDRDVRTSRRLGRRAIAQIIRRGARLAGIPQWMHITPQSLRKSFESVLRSPTIDGGRMDKGTQEFLFGHILPGSQDVYYDKTKIEFHRNEYMKLDFSKTPSRGRWTDALMAAVKIASAGLGEDPENIIDEYVRARYGGKTVWRLWPEADQAAIIKEALDLWRSRQPRNGSQPLDRVIKIKDLERYLNKGWIFVAQLNDQKVIVRRIMRAIGT